MTLNQFAPSDIARFKSLLSESGRIVITCHLSPDGDALGSSLGLKCILSQLNPSARVDVVTPDEPTKTLSFLPGYNHIVAFSSHRARVEKLIADAQVIVCLDFNELCRTDLLETALRNSSAKKIHIDHHINPEDFADVRFSYPEKCATCMLLFEIIENAGLTCYLDKDGANCLLTGMMTDTGDFTYNVTSPDIYNVIGKLISFGADKAHLTRLLFNTFSESNLRIQGFALAERMEVMHEMHAALIILSRDDLNRFNYNKGDTEGLVNKPLAIPGIVYSCYLRQENGYIKVSMRSLGDFPVNKLCADHFGGGGHRNAAGGEFYGSMNECAEIFRGILSDCKTRYIDTSAEMKAILDEELKKRK